MNKNSQMFPMIIVGVIVVGLIGAGVYVFSAQTQPSDFMSPTPTDTVESPVLTPADSQPTDLQTYQDPGGVFRISYPEKYTQDTQFNSQNNTEQVRVYFRGESQRPQSELSDGAMMVFEPISLTNQTVEEWVNDTTDPTIEKTAIELNGNPGWTFITQGLGEYQTYVIQKDPASTNALHISIMVSDLNQVGYQKEVDQILSTVQMLK